MRVEKVTITITDVDEENAKVKLEMDPEPANEDEMEETPALLLAHYMMEAVQEVTEANNMFQDIQVH